MKTFGVMKTDLLYALAEFSRKIDDWVYDFNQGCDGTPESLRSYYRRFELEYDVFLQHLVYSDLMPRYLFKKPRVIMVGFDQGTFEKLTLVETDEQYAECLNHDAVMIHSFFMDGAAVKTRVSIDGLIRRLMPEKPVYERTFEKLGVGS